MVLVQVLRRRKPLFPTTRNGQIREADLLSDRPGVGRNEKKACFGDRAHVGEAESPSVKMFGSGHTTDGVSPFSVGDHHPDPLLCKIFHEFRARYGVGGSLSGPVSGSAPENRGIGALTGAGLGVVWIMKKGGFGGWF
jgi:hypothetical protein